MSKPKKILFVCVGNSCRSQMAEGLARELAPDVMEPTSAGLSPLGTIAEATREVLRERGVEIDGQYSKGLAEMDAVSAELIVNLTGLPGKTLFPEANVLDWDVDDPYGGGLAVYRRVCDEIAGRVAQLAASLREDKPEAGAG